MTRPPWKRKLVLLEVGIAGALVVGLTANALDLSPAIVSALTGGLIACILVVGVPYAFGRGRILALPGVFEEANGVQSNESAVLADEGHGRHSALGTVPLVINDRDPSVFVASRRPGVSPAGWTRPEGAALPEDVNEAIRVHLDTGMVKAHTARVTRHHGIELSDAALFKAYLSPRGEGVSGMMLGHYASESTPLVTAVSGDDIVTVSYNVGAIAQRRARVKSKAGRVVIGAPKHLPPGDGE